MKKHSTNNTKHSKYKYTYYQNTRTIVKTPTYTNQHIIKPTPAHNNTLQDKLKQPQ